MSQMPGGFGLNAFAAGMRARRVRFTWEMARGVQFKPKKQFEKFGASNLITNPFYKICDSEHFSVAAVQLPTVDISKPDPPYQKPTMTTSPPEVRRLRRPGNFKSLIF